jgi:micrococcal nuclease
MILADWPRTRLPLPSARFAAGFCAGAVAMAAVAGTGRTAALRMAEPAAAVPAAPAAAGVRASALSVIDGDTFEARVTLFPGQEIVTRIRLAGVDAPELRGRCPGETAAAGEARQALADLVERRPLQLSELRGDKYFGRVVARVDAPDVGDVGQALVAAGHARPYGGGKRRGWC